MLHLNSAFSSPTFSSVSSHPQNPKFFFSQNLILSPKSRASRSVFSCRGIQVSLPRNGSSNGSVDNQKSTSVGVKNVDVATLGNLCVDIVLNVPQLPPSSIDDRKAYMEQLSASPPDKKFWEAGGNCNMAIAAARLGLNCITLGHVGDEVYGKFILDVLHDEGIYMVAMSEETAAGVPCAAYETLVCWVLVDPLQNHGFCSRADFSEDPAFCWMKELSGNVKRAIKQSKVLFCNGYGFDELLPGVMISALEYAIGVGTSVFFDPGPRGRSLASGTPEQRTALDKFLKMSDVLLLTADEVEALTGIQNPVLAGQHLLHKGVRTKWVIIKMGGRGSMLITASSISCVPAFEVNVVDTVGCGDSFVAAIAYGYIQSLPMVNTLALANAVGAATAMGCGAGRNVATLAKVFELIKESHLNEDETSWDELLENIDAEEITFLSKVAVNGRNRKSNHIAFREVVSELLPKLESVELGTPASREVR